MIATQEQYLAYLNQISNPDFKALVFPKGERIYKIDLNTRKSEAPTFLSVKNDYEAETILFQTDRFFENMDLTTVNCVIQYINAEGKGYLYRVPFYDKETLREEGKIIFPWIIKDPVTAASGPIQFSFQFYELEKNPDTNEPIGYLYNLNTLPAKSQVLHSLGLSKLDVNQEEEPQVTILNQIFDDINKLQQEVLDWDIYWETLD